MILKNNHFLTYRRRSVLFVRKMKRYSGITLFSIFLLLNLKTNAQGGLIDSYIKEAFENNQGLKQKQLDLQKALYALKEAKSYYLPNVSLNMNYTKAGGGRTIDLPIGDLLNPVYNSLNKLTASNNFPQISNESVLLNPDNYYDAKIHTTLPLVNLEIGYNKRIKNETITYQQAVVNVYKRELVKDIKLAYYRYYQSTQAVAIYESSLSLVNENIRVNESLLRNGAKNATALTRSQAEKQKVVASQNEQENMAKNAKAYFNFLLNRDLDAAVTLDSSLFNSGLIQQTSSSNIAAREELKQIKTSENMYKLNTDMLRSNIVPKLNAFLDMGSQDYNFKVGNKSLYYFGGLSLQWDLFAGNKNNLKIKQAETDVQSTQARYSEAERSFQLQEEQSKNNLNTAMENYKSAQKQTILSERYYNDQFKIYKEGQLLYIELVDAQNELTKARLQLATTEADIQIAIAELERNQAAYPL
jgi:outer membrane protein TolC